MLKKCRGLFLGLVVLAGSACVTPTHASSAPLVLITQIRAGSTESPLDEFIVIHNNSSVDVDMTGWCLQNKSLVLFSCFESIIPNEIWFLPAYSQVTIASAVMGSHFEPDSFAAVYEPTNQSSGSIVASNDSISLLNSEGLIVDTFSWASSLASTQVWSRLSIDSIYFDTNSSADWEKELYTGFTVTQFDKRMTAPQEPPEYYEPTPIPLHPVITEILPNAAGSDTGNEFIEIYNLNTESDILLENYQLLVGTSLEKTIHFPAGISIKAGEYVTFTNADLPYSLLNSSSRVALVSIHNALMVADIVYTSPPEAESWALIDGTWQYTDVLTPGMANSASGLVSEVANEDTETETASTLKPCAANQYRSSETNRCRLIEASSSTSPALCKADQERNPETGRCRAIASATTQTPCKEGQERNPETNRCRNIKAMTNAEHAVKGASTQQGGTHWYIWAAIAGVLLLALSYAVWEWRDELKRLIAHIKSKFVRSAN